MPKDLSGEACAKPTIATEFPLFKQIPYAAHA
jgi:hypothetical protein